MSTLEWLELIYGYYYLVEDMQKSKSLESSLILKIRYKNRTNKFVWNNFRECVCVYGVSEYPKIPQIFVVLVCQNRSMWIK